MHVVTYISISLTVWLSVLCMTFYQSVNEYSTFFIFLLCWPVNYISLCLSVSLHACRSDGLMLYIIMFLLLGFPLINFDMFICFSSTSLCICQLTNSLHHVHVLAGYGRRWSIWWSWVLQSHNEATDVFCLVLSK